MNTRILLASIATTMLFAAPVLAQEPDPGHPRINQVQNSLNAQENHTVKAEEEGKITGAQEQKDLHHDQNIQNRLDRDESAHGGHITKGEQHNLDHSLHKNHHRRVKQEHRDAQ